MSWRFLAFPILLVLSLMPRSASAETAEEMLAGCRLIANAAVSGQNVALPNDSEAHICWGAFVVVQEQTRWVTSSGSQFGACNSPTTTRTQLIAVFVAFVDRNPKRRNDNFVDVAFDALREAFPCKVTSPSKR
jgi:Rap1a immunity proteins